MSSFPRPTDEAARLARLDSYQIFRSPQEADYDQLVDFGAALFGASSCLIAITGESEHWLKARHNFPRQTLARAGAFCCYALASDEPFVCLDATEDPRFAEHPLVVGEPYIRFYAGVPLVDADGVRLGVYCIVDDKPRGAVSTPELQNLVTLGRIVSAKLDRRRATRRDASVNQFAEASALASVTTDHSGRVTSWNRAAEQMFGRRRSDVIGSSIEIIMPERFRREHAAGMRRMSEGGESRLAGKSVEIVGLAGDGSEFPIEISISSWQGPVGREYGAHIQDISERKARERRLEHIAHHDPLTGLPNRPALDERLARMLADGGRASLLRLDLDGLRIVNDTLGHLMGDALLQTVALRLRSCLDAQGFLARLGGESFAFVLAGDDPLSAGEAAADVIRAFEAPFLVGGHSVRLTVAVGAAIAPLNASEPGPLLMRAEFAMLEANKAKKSCCRFFEINMLNQLEARRSFKDELRRATIEGEWELHYQPQVSLEDGALAGFEALLRWRHPDRGLLAPAAFMSTLETHLMAYDVGCWVLDEACRQLAAWRAAGRSVPRVSVNLFAAQLHAGSLESDVAGALDRHGLKPSDLEIEVTETIALALDGGSHGGLAALKTEGVGVALDDFGTGFASLSTLKDFPVTRLKIDRSFVQDICRSPTSLAIVEAVLSIGRNLAIDVIAEGVETEEQRDRLKSIGCDWAQGYLFSRPQAPEVVPFRFDGRIEAPDERRRRRGEAC